MTPVVAGAGAASPSFATAEELRQYLLHAARAKDGRALGPLVARLGRHVMGEVDGIDVPLSSYFSGAFADPGSPLWPALESVLQASPMAHGERLLFERDALALELSREGHGWVVSIFQLPGGSARGERSGSWEWEKRLAAEHDRQRVATLATAAPRTVTIQDPIGGSRESVGIFVLVRRSLAAIVPCFAGASVGDVTMEIRADGRGKLVSLTLTPPSADGLRERCVSAALEGVRFPAPAGTAALAAARLPLRIR